MLDTSPANLRAEIEAAKRLREVRMSSWEEMIRGYHGPGFDGISNADAENTAFEIVSNLNPQIVFSNPRIKLGSSRPVYQREVIAGLEAAGNRWIEETQVRQLYDEIAVDWDFAYGVIFTCPSKVYGLGRDHEDPIYRPGSMRISPGEFVADAKAKAFRSARWLGHPVSEDKDDLIERAERENEEARKNGEEEPWNLTALHALNEGEGEEELELDRASEHVPHRKTVTFYPIWVPEAPIPEGYSPALYHGLIYYVTLSDAKRDSSGRFRSREDGDDDFIRRPEPFFGPRWGPYSFFLAYPVPDRMHPLAVMPANLANHQALNRHVEANERANLRRKKIALVDDLDPDLQKNVEDAPEGSVVPAKVSSIRDGVKEIELGGATEMGLRAQIMAKDTRDRGLGMSDAGRGSPDPNVSATADVIADRTMSRKTASLGVRFVVDGVAQHLKTVLWYIYADDRTVIFLGARSNEVGAKEGVWIGGYGRGQLERIKKEFGEELGITDEDLPEMPEEGDDRAARGYERYLSDFDLLGVSVEPFSMQRTDDPAMQARAMQAMQILMAVAPAIVQMPWIDWQPVLERLGDSLNWPGFADVVKWALANEVAAKMLQAPPEAVAKPAGPTPGTARMAGDVGAPSRMLQGGPKPRRSEPAARPFSYAANGR